MPPETTLNVASRGARSTEALREESQLCAFAPPIETRVAPSFGSSRSWAMRQRGSRKRVGPTVSVAGAESAVLAACDAATSCSPVTFCSARTTGSRTGPVALEGGQRRDDRRRGTAAIEDQPGPSGGDDHRQPLPPESRIDRGPVDGSGDPRDRVAEDRRVDVHLRVDLRPEDPGLHPLQAAHGRKPVARRRRGTDGRSPVGPHAELRCAERERAPSGDELDRRSPERGGAALELPRRRGDVEPADVEPADRRPRRQAARRPGEEDRREDREQRQEADREDGSARRDAVGASSARHSRDAGRAGRHGPEM